MKRTPIKRPPKRKAGYDDPVYRAFVHTLPCAACNARLYQRFMAGAISLPELVHLATHQVVQKTRTEMHHAGNHGFGERPPDRTGVPLCLDHHTGACGVHGPGGKRFWDMLGFTWQDLAAALQQAFDQEAVTLGIRTQAEPVPF